jgi:hypothetical protein
MRHPFDGIVNPTPISRRSWLATALASLAGLFAAGRLSAAAPPARTEQDVDPEPKPRRKPTLARGESGGPSTRALNEEGAMTRALQENGGPRATTLALNEEGARK